jgi:pimeloyl-ACP methyl ester carboxylesterase
MERVPFHNTIEVSVNLRSAGFMIAASVLAGITSAQTHLEGDWRGFWLRGGDSLRVQFEFRENSEGSSGTFASEDLRVAGVPISSIRTVSFRVHFELVGDASTIVFDGQLRGDSLSGEFLEGAATGTFFFLRGSRPPPGHLEEEVTFSNGNATLSGTLSLPGTAGPYPAVIFVHGSGAEGRWASRFLAVQFARDGIASLSFDKRGVGKSTGDWHAAGFEDLAKDVCSGVHLLRSDHRIDSRRIGIYGHSQGGAIAPLIASLCKVSFVIGSSAPGLPMDEVEIYSVGNSIGIAALGPADSSQASAYVRELVAVAYHGKERARLDSLAVTLRDRPWFFPPPPQENSYWSFSRRIAGYDPIAYWKQVNVPVLLLYGEADQRVPPEASAKRITAALHEEGNNEVTVRFFPSADHTLRLPGSGKGFSWPRNPPGYPGELTRWLQSRVIN